MRKAHDEGVAPVGELLRSYRGKKSQAAVSQELGVTQPRYQRWEALVADIDPDRELHGRIRELLGLDPGSYAKAALEHSIRVKERRR